MNTDVIRPFQPSDIPELTALRVRNNAFLMPFEPERPEGFLTEEGQRAWLGSGGGVRLAILDQDAIVGVISLSEIVRGPLQSASVGYWVSQDRNGRGLASQALAALVEHAFTELGLHRLEAGTLVDNVASQRVLVRNGFTRIGVARKHLLIGGLWRDHVLYELLADD
ncbi:MAG: [ribosomal protein S5]-alanine N-acetyltransferase [Gaiellaceae bacterium]|jgi:ribosomal-protein-alanine N-acetyltransferase|nr:[ribosomal protein S5]-alanine N-acetyltransferase [Gaiellaceae bacterium]